MRRRLLAGFGLLALLMVIALMIAVSILDRRVTEQFEGRRWTLPARVYAQPLDLYVGQSLSAERMATELRRLGYLQTESPDRPGSFHRKGNRIDAHVRDLAQRLASGFEALGLPLIGPVSGAERQHCMCRRARRWRSRQRW